MEIICPECKNSYIVTTKKYFNRAPDKRGNKIVRCPECGHRALFNIIFREIKK